MSTNSGPPKWSSSDSTFLGFPRLPRGHQGILVDKCLSPRIATGISRFGQLTGLPLSAAFSDDAKTEDEQFLGAAGEAGWAVFTQNDKMLRNPVQMSTIRSNATRLFTLTNSHLGADGGGLVFGRWLLRIRRRIDQPGPCFWRLYEDKKIHDIK